MATLDPNDVDDILADNFEDIIEDDFYAFDDYGQPYTTRIPQRRKNPKNDGPTLEVTWL